MHYRLFRNYRACECSQCGYEFEPIDYLAYEALCDACYSEQVEDDTLGKE